jgi:hypothetical protein
MSTLGGFSNDALEAYQQAIAEQKGLDFSEGDTYDFTKCVRPDGSTFGTPGLCAPPNKPAGAAVDPKKKKKESFIDKQKRFAADQKKAGFNPLAQAKGQGDRARERNKMVGDAVKGGINAIGGLFKKK